MFDAKNGIYPEGQYFIGEDLPLGKYVLTAKEPTLGMISIYDTYQKFKNDDITSYNSFDKDYYINFREWGLYIVVENADIKKV